MKLVKSDKQIINKFSKILAIIGENTQITNLSKLEFDLLEALISDEGETPKRLIQHLNLQKKLLLWKKHVLLGAKQLNLGPNVWSS